MKVASPNAVVSFEDPNAILRDTRICASPPRVNDTSGARHWIEKIHRYTIGDEDPDGHRTLIRDQPVALSPSWISSVRRASREHAIPMHLLQQGQALIGSAGSLTDLPPGVCVCAIVIGLVGHGRDGNT